MPKLGLGLGLGNLANKPSVEGTLVETFFIEINDDGVTGDLLFNDGGTTGKLIYE
jgi:hypothetical protein